MNVKKNKGVILTVFRAPKSTKTPAFSGLFLVHWRWQWCCTGCSTVIKTLVKSFV